MPKRKPKKGYNPLKIKEQLEAVWKNPGLRSPFFKALWTTTRDGEFILPRKTKEKIPDDQFTG